MKLIYLTQECQKLDWKNHKLLCKSFGDESPESTLEHGSYRRSVFFPGNAEPARFVWVEVDVPTILDDDESTYEMIRTTPFMGKDDPEHCFTKVNLIQARDISADMKESLDFWFKSYASLEDVNIGVQDFTRAGISSPVFRGPILVFKRASGLGPKGLGEAIRDLDSRDVRNAADFLSFAWRHFASGWGWGYPISANFVNSWRPDFALESSFSIPVAIRCNENVNEMPCLGKWMEMPITGQHDDIFACEGSVALLIF